MSKKKIEKRSRIKAFVKYVNFVHVMPTRYAVSESKLASLVTSEAMKTAQARSDAKKEVKKVLEAKYLNRGKDSPALRFFYQKLRF